MPKRPEDGQEHQQEDPDFTEAKRMAGERGLFVKRSAARGGRIDSGWMPTGIARDRGDDRLIVIEKSITQEDGRKKKGTRDLLPASIARLNYGRARQALEYFFDERGQRERVGQTTEELDRLVDLVDKAEPVEGQSEDAQAKVELSRYFEQRAFRSWRTKFLETKAKTLDQLEDEIAEHRSEVTEIVEAGLEQLQADLATMKKARKNKSDVTELAELDEEIEGGESSIRRLRHETRLINKDIDIAVELIHLARAYSSK